MKLNIFEGFRRFNFIVLILILIIGLIISYNSTVHINGHTIYYKEGICYFEHSDYKYLKHGSVGIKYCFEEEYDYSAMSDYAKANNLTNSEIVRYEKKLSEEWLSQFIEQIGYTLLFFAGYLALTTVIKYVVTGFTKAE